MPYAPNTELLAKYRIESLIGAGAFGEVYRALHLQLKAPRALKVLRRDAPGVGSSDFQRCRERFQLEAQLGAQLEGHSSCIQVYDFEQDTETLILVMEYAPGGSLAERLETARRARTPLPAPEVLRWTTEIAEGLAALHALDAVHRDLKPSNILFDAQGRAKLADFGLAQVPGGPSMRSRFSTPEPHPGTPAYMSPEQRESTGHLTPAADIYALGCVLFEALTGRVYRSQRPGTQVRQLRADVPEWVDDLVARCLEHEIDARPWDGAELLELLHKGEAEEAAQQATAHKVRVTSDKLTLMLVPDAALDFVRIPAGEFLMGSDPQMDPNALENEQPQRRVQLEAYWVGKHPVTNAAYAAFVQATRYSLPRHWINGQIPTGEEDHPVVNVSWEDAAAFCAWAARTTGHEVRLPTEAEWEKAARGADGRLYPWGNAAPDASRCNFSQHEPGTTPVGQYSPRGDSPYGCTDMAGNVWEWCADGYDADFHKNSSVHNPKGPAHGRSRSLRGGSWYVEGRYVRCAHRFRGASNYIFGLIGFRCAIGEPEKDQPQKRELWPVS